MTAFDTILQRADVFFQAFARDADRFLQAVGPAEKAIAVSIFGLVLMWFVIKKPSDDTRRGSDFFFALVLITLFAFGIGWVFSPEIELLLAPQALAT